MPAQIARGYGPEVISPIEQYRLDTRLTLVVSDRSLPDTPCMPRLDTDLWGLGLVYTESCSAPCTNTEPC